MIANTSKRTPTRQKATEGRAAEQQSSMGANEMGWITLVLCKWVVSGGAHRLPVVRPPLYLFIYSKFTIFLLLLFIK